MVAVVLILNGWTGDRFVRTKHAAIARLWFHQHFALAALVTVLTGIGGHELLLRVTAVWAG
jgi:hypothetical protein